MPKRLTLTTACKHCGQKFTLQQTSNPILRTTDDGWEIVVKADCLDFEAHLLTHREVLA